MIYRTKPMQKCAFNKVEVTLLHGCSPVDWLNIRRTPFLKNTFGWLFLYIWKWIQYMPAGICLYKVKMKRLQSRTKSNVKPINLLWYSHWSFYLPLQGCRVVIVGSFLENSNFENEDFTPCSSVLLFEHLNVDFVLF